MSVAGGVHRCSIVETTRSRKAPSLRRVYWHGRGHRPRRGLPRLERLRIHHRHGTGRRRRPVPPRRRQRECDGEAEGVNEAIDGSNVRRYLTSMKTRLSSKGQLVLPAESEATGRNRTGPGVRDRTPGSRRIPARSYDAARQPGACELALGLSREGVFVAIESESTESL